MGSAKPIASVYVLSNGPTQTLRLPVRGVTEFVPGTTLKVFDAADLEYLKANFPSDQMRLREFPRSLPDDPPASSAPATPPKGKGKPAK